jgi:hypothetical protein
MVKSFEPFGIMQHHIEARIQRNIEAIDAYLLSELRTIYASLKDGMGEPSDYFDMDARPKQSGLGKKPEKPVVPEPTPSSVPTSEQQEEPEQGGTLAGMFDDGGESF